MEGSQSIFTHANVEDAQIVEVEHGVQLATLLVHGIGAGGVVEATLGLATLMVESLRDVVWVVLAHSRSHSTINCTVARVRGLVLVVVQKLQSFVLFATIKENICAQVCHEALALLASRSSDALTELRCIS